MGKYDDIIDLPRHVSRAHPQMARADRAKQFMPFAALRGYEEAIADKQVIWVPRRELGEEQRDRLDAQLQDLSQLLSSGQRPRVSLRYFTVRPDQRDAAVPLGQYHALSGTAIKMDLEGQRLRLDSASVPLADITALRVGEDGDEAL